MNNRIDLTNAPREALLEVIAQQQSLIGDQQAVIGQLQRRIESLEGKAKPGGPKGMPGLKPKGRSGGPPAKAKGQRETRPHGFALAA